MLSGAKTETFTFAFPQSPLHHLSQSSSAAVFAPLPSQHAQKKYVGHHSLLKYLERHLAAGVLMGHSGETAKTEGRQTSSSTISVTKDFLLGIFKSCRTKNTMHKACLSSIYGTQLKHPLHNTEIVSEAGNKTTD